MNEKDTERKTPKSKIYRATVRSREKEAAKEVAWVFMPPTKRLTERTMLPTTPETRTVQLQRESNVRKKQSANKIRFKSDSNQIQIRLKSD